MTRETGLIKAITAKTVSPAVISILVNEWNTKVKHILVHDNKELSQLLQQNLIDIRRLKEKATHKLDMKNQGAD